MQVLMTYNLYRGGADEARVRQTIAQGYAARDVADYTCRNIQQELSVSWNNMRVCASNCLSCVSTAVHQQGESGYQQQFQIGQRRCWTCWIPRTSCSMHAVRCSTRSTT
jgi:adhesin transport system outer membrane protein